MKKLYVFDLDGTLLDTLDDLTNACNKALTDFKYPHRTREEVKEFIGDGVAKLMERAQPDGLDTSRTRELLVRFKMHYATHLTEHTAPYSGIPELLDLLKSEGKTLAILTNKPHEQANILGKQHFPGRFDYILGQSEKFPRKPEPTSFHYLIDTLGFQKEEAIYIGDSDVDMRTGKHAGVYTIGVTWGYRDEKLLVHTGADKIAYVPEDIIL